MNDRIRAREVRLIDEDGEQLGVKPLPEAMRIARDRDLDLVEVAPMANPPVCRVMDYGKFKFDAAQKAREARRKGQNVSIKEMKYRVKIGPGDFDTKTRKVQKFLEEGHKVKLTIMFRGREMDRPQFGKAILDRVAERVMGVGKVEYEPRLDGRNMIMVLAPERRLHPKASTEVGHSSHGAADSDESARVVASTTAATTAVTAATPNESKQLHTTQHTSQKTSQIDGPKIATKSAAAPVAEAIRTKDQHNKE